MNFTIPDVDPLPCVEIESVRFFVNNFNFDVSGLIPPCAFNNEIYINVYDGSCVATGPGACPSGLEFNNPVNPDGFDITFDQNDFDLTPGMSLGFDIVINVTPPCGQDALDNNQVSATFEVCCTVTYVDKDSEDPIELDDDFDLCEGQFTDLLAPNGYSDYEWFGPNGSFLGQELVGVGAGIYTIEALDSEGCPVTDEIVVNEIPPEFEILFSPDDPYIVCEGSPQFISVAIFNGGGTYIYEWEDPQGVTSGTSLILPTTSGTYNLTVTDDDTGCQKSSSITVSLSSLNPAQIEIGIDSIAPLLGEICENETLMLTSFIPYDDTNTYSYQWLNGVDTVFTANNVIDAQGTYVLNLLNDINCPVSSDTITINQIIPNTAGSDNSMDFCGMMTIDMYSLISNDALPVGLWVDLSNTGGLNGSDFTTGTLTGSFDFQYIVENDFPCVNDTAIITLVLDQGITNPPCPADVIVSCVSDIQEATISFGTLINVVGPVLISGLEACDDAVYQLTYEIMGDCGETINCSQSFTLQSNAPTITCPVDAVVECSEEVIPQNIDDIITQFSCIDMTGTINIEDPVLESGTGDCDGTEYSITYIVEDNCGRTSSCTQFFTLSNQAPDLECPENQVVLDETEIMPGDPIIIPFNCDFTLEVENSVVELVSEATTCEGAIYEIEYVVTDDCGRTNSCVQSFTTQATGPFAGFDVEENLCAGIDLNLNTLIDNGDPDGSYYFENGDEIADGMLNTSTLDTGIPNIIRYVVEVATCGSDTAEIIINIDDQIVTLINDELCNDGMVTVNNTIYDITNQSGEEMLTSANECDSLVIIELSFIDMLDTLIDDVLCNDGEITVNNTIYNISNPSGEEMLTSSGGCDSLITIELSFIDVLETTLDPELCEGEQVIVNNNTYDQTTPTGQETLQSSGGCDSIVTINLNFTDALFSTVDDQLCPDESVTVNNNIYDIDTPTGTETLQSIMGCDSIVTIDLTFMACNTSLPTLLEHPDCFGEANGDIIFNFDGQASFPLSYTVTDQDGNEIASGTIVDNSSQLLENLESGDYTITIIDNTTLMVIVEETVSLIDPDIVEVNSQITQELLCDDSDDGSVMLTASGGTGSLNFSWETIPSSDLIENLSAGTYAFAVEDENGCSDTGTILLEAPSQIIFDINPEPADCGLPNGSIELINVSGGTDPYTYELGGDGFIGQNSFADLSAGNYSGLIEDDNGCQVSWTTQVDDTGGLSLDVLNDVNINLGESYSSPLITIPFTAASFEWDAATDISCIDCLDPVFTPSETTTYTLNATDENGCMVSESFTITVNEVISLNDQVYVPNTFSLDGPNSINNLFKPFTAMETAVVFETFRIYDRWGNLVHNEEGIINGWDGFFDNKKAEIGVYVYVLIYNVDGRQESKFGELTLVR